MGDFKIADLPESTAVDVVILSSSTADRVARPMDEWLQKRSIRVDDEIRQKIENLCRSLPYDKCMRCHIPPVGLRFYQGETLVCAFSICWRCNNAIGECHGRRVGFHFDGTSEIAVELFSVIQAVVGPDALNNREIT